MGKRVLILNADSGISGDMTAAALLDLGASEKRLREALATLPVSGYEVAVSHVDKSGIRACDFDVRLDAEHENHDHDMAWLFGHEGEGSKAGVPLEGEAPAHDHEHVHSDHAHAHAAAHGHGHAHDHDAHGHHHEHRTLADVLAIIDASGMSERARDYARSVFGVLAEAEAKAHGATPQTVHFHEVGAVDSIVDVCSVAVLLDDLDVQEVVIPYLAEGHGTVRCAHGIMPIPVPATANACAAAGIRLVDAHVRGELVTPTGAAIAAALGTTHELPSSYRILACGYGAGKRSYEGCSELLRAVLADGEDVGGHADPCVTKLECDLDDCTGEALGRTIELLMEAGARDAHALPLVMKKGRPGWQLQVICDEANAAQLEELIFKNTTTIGIRSCTMQRRVLPRRADEVQTPYGAIATKVVALPDGSARAYPEYGSVVDACEKTGASFEDVFFATMAAAAGAGETSAPVAAGAGTEASPAATASAAPEAPAHE